MSLGMNGLHLKILNSKIEQKVGKSNWQWTKACGRKVVTIDTLSTFQILHSVTAAVILKSQLLFAFAKCPCVCAMKIQLLFPVSPAMYCLYHHNRGWKIFSLGAIMKSETIDVKLFSFNYRIMVLLWPLFGTSSWFQLMRMQRFFFVWYWWSQCTIL